MIRKYEKILKIFDDLDNKDICPPVEMGYAPCKKCDTKFTYPLDEDGRQTIKHALDNFQKTIAYVLAFNPKITEVTLDNNGVIHKYKVLNRKQVT